MDLRAIATQFFYECVLSGMVGDSIRENKQIFGA